jgi:multisubunit Na+/H+ antiporter MnhB subunit
LIVTAAYLLWIGSKAPGGAFQAGALLAAGGILFLLSDAPVPLWPAALGRGLITLGLAGFTGMALGPTLAGFAPFTYPPAHAGALILAVETGATLSIAAVLVGLFHGGRPRANAP